MPGCVKPLVGRGKEVSDSRVADSPSALLKGPLLRGRSSQGPQSLALRARACLHFHPGRTSPLNGHCGAAEERPPPVQRGDTHTSQPVSPASFAVHFGTFGTFVHFAPPMAVGEVPSLFSPGCSL